jgi:hypothetical protein
MSELSDRLVRAFESTADPITGLAGALRVLAARGDYIEFALNPQGYLRSIAAELESGVDR